MLISLSADCYLQVIVGSVGHRDYRALVRWTSRLFLPWGRNVLESENQYGAISNYRWSTEDGSWVGDGLPVQPCSGQATVLCSLALLIYQA